MSINGYDFKGHVAKMPRVAGILGVGGGEGAAPASALTGDKAARLAELRAKKAAGTLR